MTNVCQEVFFSSPKLVVRVELPRPALVTHVRNYIRREIHRNMPEYGYAPASMIYFDDEMGILRVEIFDRAFFILKPPENMT